MALKVKKVTGKWSSRGEMRCPSERSDSDASKDQVLGGGIPWFSEVGWDPRDRRCAGAPRFYTTGISLYRTLNWTSRQLGDLENSRNVGGSIITTA